MSLLPLAYYVLVGQRGGRKLEFHSSGDILSEDVVPVVIYPSALLLVFHQCVVEHGRIK